MNLIQAATLSSNVVGNSIRLYGAGTGSERRRPEAQRRLGDQ